MSHDGKNHSVIVVVDDDPDVCSSLKFSLEVEGFNVRTFLDGESLLSEDISPDTCCVIDYYLPGMNGLELIKALRERHARLPAVLVTTHPPQALRNVAAVEHIPIVEKPLLGNTLIDGIREAWSTESAATRPTEH